MSKKIGILFLLLLFYINAYAEPKKHFYVSYDPDYTPFTYLAKNSPEGLLIDYWKLWAKRNNYKISFINGGTWKNATLLAKEKKVDFFIGSFAYESWMRESKAYYKTQTSLFIKKSNVNTYDTSSRVKIGIIGKDYKKSISSHMPNALVTVYVNYDSVIKDLIDKKIDMFYDDKIAVEFYSLQNKIFHGIQAIDLINEHTPKCAISANEELIKIFNNGLKKISENELLEIKKKWILNQDFKFFKNNSKNIKLSEKEKEFIKNTKIKVAASKNWKPFNFQAINNKASGISTEIWELISKKLKLNSEFNFSDQFTKQLQAIKTKQLDIIYSTGKTKEREEYAIFTDPYIKFPLSIVTLKDENFIENISYLFDKKIAVGKNFTAHKMLKDKYPNMNFILVNTIKNGLNAVKEGNAYAYIDMKPTLTYNINKLGLNELKITGNTGLDFELRMMIREDYVLLQSILNKTIASLNDKEVNDIMQKWNNIQFEDSFDYKKLWLILIIIFALFGILLYRNQLEIRRSKSLEKMVQARTKELIHLNETLEHRVRNKTKELIKANNLLDEAQKIAHLGSYHYHIKDKKLTWSNELFKIFEVFPNKVNPTKELLLKFVHLDDRSYVKEQLDIATNSTKKITFEFRILLRNKKIKYLQSTSKASQVNGKNEPLTLIGTILDLTKLKTLENEKREQDSILAQQAKMAAMGEMLENIAHQWRQPLSVISTASTGLQIQYEMNKEIPEEFLLENIDSINKQAQYLSKTIDDFRNFFNPNKIKVAFDIQDSIDKSLYLLSSKIKAKNISIIKEIENSTVFALENELIQVLLNIFNNALDALSFQENQKLIFIKIQIKNSKLRIEICDNAGGIDNEILPRVFEPYFTTKHKSQGTGIGLYMSREIITKHLHGAINVTNKSYDYDNITYKGANFRISIPLHN